MTVSVSLFSKNRNFFCINPDGDKLYTKRVAKSKPSLNCKVVDLVESFTSNEKKLNYKLVDLVESISSKATSLV
jgi:hypothetical protein